MADYTDVFYLRWIDKYRGLMEMRREQHVFVSNGRGPKGYLLWPNDEFLSRRKCKSEVASRIRRVSGGFQEEGEWPRGYKPKFHGKRWLKKPGNIGDYLRVHAQIDARQQIKATANGNVP
jgi:hypothetical protein